MRHAFIHRDLSKRDFKLAFEIVRKLKGLPLGNQDLNLMLAQQVRWSQSNE